MKIMIFFFLLLIVNNVFGQKDTLELGLPLGHFHSVIDSRFTKDGKKIITTSKDFTTRIWDAQNGRLLFTLGGRSILWGNPSSVSPDSESIIIIDGVEFVPKVYKIANGEQLITFDNKKNDIYYSVFTAQGNQILNFSRDGKLFFKNIESGQVEQSIEGLFTDGNIISLNKDENLLAFTTKQENIAVLWDLDKSKQICFLKHDLDDNGSDGSSDIRSIDFSPDGRKVITSSNDGTAIIWDTKTGVALHSLKHDKTIFSSKFSPDGKKIVTASADGTAKLWSGVTGDYLLTLKGHIEMVFSATFSSDNQKILTSSYDKTAKIWKSADGSLLKTLNGHSNSVRVAAFDESGEKVITSSDDFTSKVWNAETGKQMFSLGGHTKILNYVEFSPDMRNVLMVYDESPLIVWESQTGKLSTIEDKSIINSANFSLDGQSIVTTSDEGLTRVICANSGIVKGILENPNQKESDELIEVHTAKFSPDGEKIAIGSADGFLRIWDWKSSRLLKQFRIKSFSSSSNAIYSLDFSSDGKKIAAAELNSIKIWDIYDNKLLNNFKDKWLMISSIHFDKSGEKLLVNASGENRVSVWNLKDEQRLQNINVFNKIEFPEFGLFVPNKLNVLTNSPDGKGVTIWDSIGKRIPFELKGGSDIILNANYNMDGSKIITSSADGSFSFWNTLTGQKISQTFVFDEKETLTLLPNNYYMATPKAATLLYYIKGDQTIGFDQLDVKYNRPDKVLEAIGAAFGNPDKNLIESYRKAYEKRIKKLGIDTTSFESGFSIPESDFKNRDVIEYEQSGNQLTLKVWGKDEDYQIDRYNVWVNEVPVFGEKGINVRNKNLNEINETVTITLSDGDNRIETSIMNVNGIESYRIPLYVRYEPKQPSAQKLYYVGIGVNQYQQSENNLNFSVPDIEDLSKAFKEKYGANIEVHTLLNDKVTVENVLALKDVLMKTTVNDKVIISFSGHGLLDDEFDYYLATHDIDFNNPKLKGLSYEALESLLDGIPARKKLLMIDACHSGEVDKEELVAINNLQNKPGIKGAKVVAYKGSGLGLKNSFELMQEVFVNVNRGTGATVISASGGTQFAYEGKGLTNGVFTYSILEMMKESSRNGIKVSELKTQVGKRVEQLTDGLQKPTSRNETVEFDWEVW